MAVTYAGALNFGPEGNSTFAYDCVLPAIPAGDFAVFILAQLEHLVLGVDPDASVADRFTTLAQTHAAGAAGTSGNDCAIHVSAVNTSTAANRGQPRARIARGGNILHSSGSHLLGTSTFRNDDIVLFVLQSNGGTVQFKTAKKGAAAVSEASQARNGSFVAGTTGTWRVGLHNCAHTIQMFGMANRAFTDSEIADIAAGVDLDSIVTSGDRLALWLFDSVGASIASIWGAAAAATRSTAVTTEAVVAPAVPNAAQRIEAAEFKSYQPIGVDATHAAPTHTFTGTYTGFTPATFEARILNVDGTVAQDWTSLGAFSAAAGEWSGTLTIPIGGPYRFQIRDSTATTITYGGRNQFLVCPVTLSTGQSPHVILSTGFQAKAPTLTASKAYYAKESSFLSAGEWQMMKAQAGSLGAGWVAAVNRWEAITSVPLVAYFTAEVGTSSTQWATESAATWGRLLEFVDWINPKRALYTWLQGAGDVGNSAADIKTNLDTIAANFAADIATARSSEWRWMILPHNRNTGSETNHRRTGIAQYEWARDHAEAGTRILIGPWWGNMRTEGEPDTGTAQAGGASTITIAAADENAAASAWTGGTVTILSGTGAGQTRTVSSYNITTKVLTVSSPWTTVPDSTSVYRIIANAAHPYSAATLWFGPYVGQELAKAFGYTSTSGRGPAIASATREAGSDGSVIDVTVTHRSGSALRTPRQGTGATTVTGFQVSEDNFSTTETISSVEIIDADTVRITLAAPPAAPASLKVRHNGGYLVTAADWDVNGSGLRDLLYDDAGMGAEGGIPVEFTAADLAVTEAPVPSDDNPAAVDGTLTAVGGTLTTA